MKKFKILSLLLALVMVFGIFVGCQKTDTKVVDQKEATEEVKTKESKEEVKEEAKEEAKEEKPAEEGKVTVVDMLDREVTFEKTPERIVAITPSDAEILYALGVGDKIVGKGTYVDAPESSEVPVVASGSEMNAEEIIALEPDLVVMSDMAQTESQTQTLTSAGINVLMTKSGTIEEVYKAIRMVGKVVGKSEQSEKVVGDMESVFDELKKTAEENKGKKIYFEVSPLEYGLWSAGKNTFMNEISDMLGLENIFADVEGWSEVSEEQIISRNPDYIVTISMGTTSGETPIEEILGRKGWEEISAVKNKRVLHLANNELSRPSPRLTEGAKALLDFIKESK